MVGNLWQLFGPRIHLSEKTMFVCRLVFFPPLSLEFAYQVEEKDEMQSVGTQDCGTNG